MVSCLDKALLNSRTFSYPFSKSVWIRTSGYLDIRLVPNLVYPNEFRLA